MALGGSVYGTDFNGRGQPTLVTYTNGATLEHIYSATRGFLEQIIFRDAGGTIIAHEIYTHTADGRIATRRSLMDAHDVDYTYDHAGRLITADNVTDNAFDRTFTYDAGGRLLSKSDIGAYVYPSGSAARPHSPTTVAGAGLSYDANGNQLTGYGAKTLAWDAENRPLTVSYAGQTTTYIYGPDGSRLKMTVGTGGGAETTLYTGAAEIRNYGQGAAEIVTRHPGADIREVNGAQSLMALDHLASVLLMTDATGYEARTTAYAPYGAIAAETVANAAVETETKGYISERFDQDAGLQYLNARYYDPALGLFTSPDWWEVTNPGVGTNRYAYAGGDPVNLMDPGGNALSPAGEAQLASFLENDGNFSYQDAGLWGLDPNRSAESYHRDAGSFFVSELFGPNNLSFSTMDVSPQVLDCINGGMLLEGGCAGGGGGIWVKPAPSGPTWVDKVLAKVRTLFNGKSIVYNSSDDIIHTPDSTPPFRGEPGTTVVGGTQGRRYGADGYPEIDRDWPHPDEKGIGSGDHSHDWGRPEGGGPPTHEDRGISRKPGLGDPPKPRGPNVPPP